MSTYIKNSIDPVGIQKYKDYIKPTGEETLLGYPCSVYMNAEGSMIWVYDGNHILKVFNNIEYSQVADQAFCFSKRQFNFIKRIKVESEFSFFI